MKTTEVLGVRVVSAIDTAAAIFRYGLVTATGKSIRNVNSLRNTHLDRILKEDFGISLAFQMGSHRGAPTFYRASDVEAVIDLLKERSEKKKQASLIAPTAPKKEKTTSSITMKDVLHRLDALRDDIETMLKERGAL